MFFLDATPLNTLVRCLGSAGRETSGEIGTESWKQTTLGAAKDGATLLEGSEGGGDACLVEEESISMASTEGGMLSIVGTSAGASKTMSSLRLHFFAAEDSSGGELPLEAAEARLVDVFCLEREAVAAFAEAVETLVTMSEVKEKECQPVLEKA